jgi:hypothetical protein
MKRTILALLAASAIQLPATDIYEAIAYEESRGIDCAVGDNGEALGRYQIHKIYVDDVSRIAKTNYTYDDRLDAEKSLAMVKIYLDYYGRRYSRLTGRLVTDEVMARIHNGGPDGFRKQSTVEYWNRVKEIMERGQ